MRHVVFLALLASSACTAPTLQQRQANWERWRDVNRATCLVGMAKDPAMPDDVRAFCVKLVEP